MFIRNLALILLSLAICMSSKADGSKSNCENIFNESVQGIEPRNDDDTITYEAFEVIGKHQGIHGGERIVVRRTGSWFDFEKELKKRGDLVIDLRFFPHVLGEEEAYFFGFQIFDDHHITLPSLDELNGAIEKYNNLLPMGDPRRMLLRYYGTPDVHNTVNEYVTRFRENLGVPISSNGKSFFHDVSSHSMQGFFVDNLLIEAIDQRVELALSALDYINSRFRDSPEEFRVKKLSSKIKGGLVGLIDQIGGFVGLAPNKDMRSYFARIGIEQYNEGVRTGNQNEMDSNWTQMVADNGAIHRIGFYHFDWILSSDFESFFKKEVRSIIATEFIRYENLRQFEAQVVEAIEEFFDQEQSRERLEQIYGLKAMIEDAKQLERSLRVFAYPPPSTSRIRKAIERIGSLVIGGSNEPVVETNQIDSDLLTEFEMELSTHVSMRAYVNRLIFLRQNLNRLLNE